MSEFHIDKAYCLELGYDVDILEASDYYFSLPHPQRRRLHFECPDADCREAFHPEIVGVNYDKELSIRPMHFRRNGHAQHSDDCSLGVYEKTLQNMLQNKNKYKKISDRNLFLNIAQSEEIPDIFQPQREVKAKRKESAGVPQHHGETIKGVIPSVEDRILRAQYKTRSLKVVVAAFENLELDQRSIPSLNIEGHQMSYGKAFKHIRYMEEWHHYPHIYYGSARIYFSSKEGGFRAFFDERVQNYLPNKTNIETSIFFPLENGNVPNFHPYDALQRAAKTKEHCCVYMFASRTLVNAPLGSSLVPKEWIKLSTQPGETVITFNMRLCK